MVRNRGGSVLSLKVMTKVSLTKEEDNMKRKADFEQEFIDPSLHHRFAFRFIRPEEADQAAKIEEICFPPNEACSAKMMKERVAAAPDFFLVAADRETGRLAGFLNGLATDEEALRDEFFKDAALHDPKGRNIMLLGLDVLPAYRGQGLARELMYQYLRREWQRGRETVILTCLEGKIKMYEKMGFENPGISGSVWGGEQWYEMSCRLCGGEEL